MGRKFKARKKIKKNKILIYLFITCLIYIIYLVLSNISINKVNNSYLKYLIKYYHNYSYKEDEKINPIESISERIQVVFNSPKSLLINNYKYQNHVESKEVVVSSNNSLVYIYNTHQREEYNQEYVEDYNIVPDVLLMSHIIQEKLNNDHINTIVEENDIVKYLKDNDMNYGQSYQASRVFLRKVIEENKGLKLIIDLHRDAANYENTTVEIDGLKCAKVMFVVGKEYATYKNNLAKTNVLNDKIKKKYPSLTRGVLQKSGAGVNGIYNQDLSSNIMLLELGGNKNNIDELTNTINLIVPIIEEYIHENQ